MLLSIFYFLLAGIAEIGGGYLVWLYMRDDKSPLYLLAGAFPANAGGRSGMNLIINQVVKL